MARGRSLCLLALTLLAMFTRLPLLGVVLLTRFGDALLLGLLAARKLGLMIGHMAPLLLGTHARLLRALLGAAALGGAHGRRFLACLQLFALLLGALLDGAPALLGLLVGAVVTMQTLYSATIASAREYATLFALGIPRWRVYVSVLQQAFWIGVFGILLAYPVVQLLAAGARAAGTQVILRWEVLAGTAVVTMGMALLAGLFALRSVRNIEPMSLLR